MAIAVGAQTYGFGLFEMPPMDNGTWIYRWLSARTVKETLVSPKDYRYPFHSHEGAI